MSLWISSLKQLEPAKHLFTPLLWDFMEAAWPSPISLVIPRGEENVNSKFSRELWVRNSYNCEPLKYHILHEDIPVTITGFGLMQISGVTLLGVNL